jgi:outer membrane protein assembly factor BamD (BamD/ComL family)
MYKYIQIILITFFVFYLFSCGSGGKKRLKIGDESADELLAKAELSFKEKEYDNAIEYCKALVHNYPISDLHIDAQITIAKALGAKEKFEDQFDLLIRLINENKIPEKVPLIFIQIGEFYEHAAVWNPNNVSTDSTDLAKAAQYYRRAVFYPNSDDKTTQAYALYRAALINAKLNKLDIATRAYEHLVANYPESPYSTLAKIKLTNPSNIEEITIESETAKSLEKERKKELERSAKEAEKEKATEEEQLIKYPDELGDKEKTEEMPVIQQTNDQQDDTSKEVKEEEERKKEAEPQRPPSEEPPVMEIPE